MKEYLKELAETAERFQKEAHVVADYMTKELKNMSYDDAIHVWTYKKLAEFELRLKKLESK